MAHFFNFKSKVKQILVLNSEVNCKLEHVALLQFSSLCELGTTYFCDKKYEDDIREKLF
jgi:hypothetical protein